MNLFLEMDDKSIPCHLVLIGLSKSLENSHSTRRRTFANNLRNSLLHITIHTPNSKTTKNIHSAFVYLFYKLHSLIREALHFIEL